MQTIQSIECVSPQHVHDLPKGNVHAASHPTLAANRCDAVSGEYTKVRITECRVSTLHDEKSLIAIPTPRGRNHDRQHNRPNRPAWPPLRDYETPRAVRPLTQNSISKKQLDFRTHAPPARSVREPTFSNSHQ